LVLAGVVGSGAQETINNDAAATMTWHVVEFFEKVLLRLTAIDSCGPFRGFWNDRPGRVYY
jgi:hypothetical protein